MLAKMLPQSLIFAFLLSSTVSALPEMVDRRYPGAVVPNPGPHHVRDNSESSRSDPGVPVGPRAEVTPQPRMAEKRYPEAIVPNPAPHPVQKRVESFTPGAHGVPRAEVTPQPRMAEKRAESAPVAIPTIG